MSASLQETGREIWVRRRELADALVRARVGESEREDGATARETQLQEAEYQLSFLAQALEQGSPALFIEYIAWTKIVHARRQLPASELIRQFRQLADLLSTTLPAEQGVPAARFVKDAMAEFDIMPDDLPSALRAKSDLSGVADEYLAALLRGERHVASRLILAEVATGTAIKRIYLHVFEPVMHEVGRLWQTNRISVAQEHYCTAATQLIMSQLYPHIFVRQRKGATLVATCVAGDLHELGVRMVADFFEMDGWDTFYLGANMPQAEILALLSERKPDVLAVSATMPYHVEAVRRLIQAVRANAACAPVKILVGGYPFNRDPNLWKSVHADGYAANAETAVEWANKVWDHRA